MRARLFVMLLAVTLCAYAKTQLLEHITLRWKPTSELRKARQRMDQQYARRIKPLETQYLSIQ